MKTIYFLRHGEAMDDLYNQYGGWADPELSAKGVNKAFTVAQYFKEKGVPFEIIYTSPLKRAHTKAEVLSRELHIPLLETQYLKERNTYGLLCGMNKDYAKNNFPELIKLYREDKFILGSERVQDFVDRVKILIKFLISAKEDNILCITHSGIIAAIIKRFLEMNPENLSNDCMLAIGLDKDEIHYIESEGITFAKPSHLRI